MCISGVVIKLFICFTFGDSSKSISESSNKKNESSVAGWNFADCGVDVSANVMPSFRFNLKMENIAVKIWLTV